MDFKTKWQMIPIQKHCDDYWSGVDPEDDIICNHQSDQQSKKALSIVSVEFADMTSKKNGNKTYSNSSNKPFEKRLISSKITRKHMKPKPYKIRSHISANQLLVNFIIEKFLQSKSDKKLFHHVSNFAERI